MPSTRDGVMLHGEGERIVTAPRPAQHGHLSVGWLSANVEGQFITAAHRFRTWVRVCELYYTVQCSSVQGNYSVRRHLDGRKGHRQRQDTFRTASGITCSLYDVDAGRPSVSVSVSRAPRWLAGASG